jgi:hypothetical protein
MCGQRLPEFEAGGIRVRACGPQHAAYVLSRHFLALSEGRQSPYSDLPLVVPLPAVPSGNGGLPAKRGTPPIR